MKNLFYLSSAVIALAVPGTAFAQSTGSEEFDDENVVIITGSVNRDVGGVDLPDSPKAKQALGEEIIRRQRPGQTVNDIVNLVPGVSFQNNDPWGSSGGSFTIRGFDDTRISQTLDGLPLNDSGNYSLYTNQQVDPEILERVTVNLGVTDVDSPTASAVGGTINIRTREPADEFLVTATMTAGDIFAEGDDSGVNRLYMRGFAMVDTGDITGMGTKAFFSASYTDYNSPFNNYSRVQKQQYNGSIWQDIGSNGDFIAISGHYNENRNNFFGSKFIGDIIDAVEDGDKSFRFYEIDYPCTLPEGTLANGGGVNGTSERYSDSSSSGDCGSEFDRRYNPSNTGNIRGSSLFTLADGLVLSIDPSFQYVKANGGGVEDLREGFYTTGGEAYTGFLSGGYYYGRDLNGDGDLDDRIAGTDPSQTRTRRYGVIANLAYDISDDHRVRISYTHDNANHRQTGQTAFLLPNGEPTTVFPVNDGLETSDGFVLNKRDRQSYAILNQISGEYRGHFGNLTAVLGVRAPFFTRKLDQRCYTTSASGFVDCIGGTDANYEAANADHAPPVEVDYKYDKLLPNVGVVYNWGDVSLFANYAKGLSVPGTDELYDSLYFSDKATDFQPDSETTDSIDAGVRFQSGRLQAQLAGWFTRYSNRRATAYDPILDETIARNLGQVDKYGIDGSISFAPTDNTLLYVFGSLNESEIKDNVLLGVCDQDNVDDGDPGCNAVGDDLLALTAGKKESGTPLWSIGARGQIALGPVEFGVQAKHTGKRWINDINADSVGGYTLVDLDVRVRLGDYLAGREAALQFNITNLFDEFYVGGFGGDLDGFGFAQFGPPRAASVSLLLGF